MFWILEPADRVAVVQCLHRVSIKTERFFTWISRGGLSKSCCTENAAAVVVVVVVVVVVIALDLPRSPVLMLLALLLPSLLLSPLLLHLPLLPSLLLVLLLLLLLPSLLLVLLLVFLQLSKWRRGRRRRRRRGGDHAFTCKTKRSELRHRSGCVLRSHQKREEGDSRSSDTTT